MKFFAFIMAIMVLFQSCMPCGDEAVLMKAGKAQMELTHDHQEDHEHTDACSPFCHCACCASFSITRPFVSIPALLPAGSVSFSSFYTGSVINISLPVWQPPQLTA